MKAGFDDDRNSVLDEFGALTAVKNFVDDSENDSFDLGELEDIYIEKLAERGRVIKSHRTRFAAQVETADLSLTVVQSSDRGKYRAFKTQRLRSIISDSDWVNHLRHVVEPIRQEIFEIHKLEKPAMSDLSTDWSPLPYPKLRFLMSYLCHGQPNDRNIPLPLEIMCQHIILNTNKTSRRSSGQIIRHSREKECFHIQHETLKLYSIVCCKSLIHVFYEHGIILSYDRINSFLGELSHKQ